ncbi:hypothetical protein [Flavobacterium johnsoniae]|nr:hypothetical protein [Flavobacterium johnsoniae]
MAKKETTRKIGRDSESGQFISIEKAKKNPKTTQVETIKVPTKRSK